MSEAYERERQNDARLNELSAKVSALRGVTIDIFIIALIMVFYYRKLQARRDIDMTRTPGGEPIELKDGSSSIGAAASSGPLTPTRVDTTTRHLQRASISASSIGPRPPLWKYIHWKNPNNAILPRVEPRRDVRGTSIYLTNQTKLTSQAARPDDIPIPPNPYYR